MENEKIVELMEKMYENLKGDIDGLKGDVNGLKGDIKQVDKRVEKVEKITIKMEQEHGQKLDALFDGYKQNSEQLNRIEHEVAKDEEVVLRKIK